MPGLLPKGHCSACANGGVGDVVVYGFEQFLKAGMHLPLPMTGIAPVPCYSSDYLAPRKWVLPDSSRPGLKKQPNVGEPGLDSNGT